MDEKLKKPIVLRIAGDKKGRRSSQFVTKAESSSKRNGIEKTFLIINLSNYLNKKLNSE